MSERREFLDALSLWDRPEEELHQKAFDADLDVDAFVEAAIARLIATPTPR